MRGAWNTDGGTLNSTAVGQSDSVESNLPCFGNGAAEDMGTGAVYSARLRNEYGTSGNLVGLIYNSRRGQHLLNGGDYYEVVFSTTGIMQLNKFIEGVRYPVRTLTHNIPRNTWFNVQVIRSGIFTDVKLNGVTVVSQLPQGELRGGGFDVITHWAKGRFDNVSLESRVSRPPSERIVGERGHEHSGFGASRSSSHSSSAGERGRAIRPAAADSDHRQGRLLADAIAVGAGERHLECRERNVRQQLGCGD